MGSVIRFPRRHARAFSAGYKSGRSSVREMPVSRSIGNTNSAGTPRLEPLSQYQTSDCLVPIRSASFCWLPAKSQARLSASLGDMAPEYLFLGNRQPKNLSGTPYQKFGKVPSMKNDIDPVAFGKRVEKRRNELEWSQARLGKEAGYSQSNIDWIEKGGPKNPKKYALELAEALQTTADWLMYEKGPKEIGPHVMTREELRKAFEELPAEGQFEVRVALTEMFARLGIKKKKA